MWCFWVWWHKGKEGDMGLLDIAFLGMMGRVVLDFCI